MRARKPPLDFAGCQPAWAPEREFAQLLNASSIVIMKLEPFLNTAMRRAKEALPAGDPLRDEIDVFIAQESMHTLLHGRFNRTLHAAGYDRLKAIERQLGADYERYLSERSLRFLLGYCQGFECVGPLLAEFLFEQADDLLAGADPQVVALWKWQLAEEYEHRRVAHEAFRRLGGGWLARVVATLTTLRHLRLYRERVEGHLLEVDRRGLSPEQAERSRRASARLHRRLSRFLLPRTLRVLLPGYSPTGWRAPRGVERLLASEAGD